MEDDLERLEREAFDKGADRGEEVGRADLPLACSSVARLRESGWGGKQEEDAHLEHSRRVEQEVALEDGEAAGEGVCPVCEERHECRHELQHLGGEDGRAAQEDLPQLEAVLLQVDV